MHTYWSMNKYTTFLLQEETSLAPFGLQMTAVATAVTGCRNRAQRKARSWQEQLHGAERQDRLNDSTCRLLWIRHVRGWNFWCLLSYRTGEFFFYLTPRGKVLIMVTAGIQRDLIWARGQQARIWRWHVISSLFLLLQENGTKDCF